jgi:hypothetical protein
MQGWFLIQTFYHGLKHTSREHLDAAAGGAFFSLQVPAAKELIEKMVANQDWDGDRLHPRTRGVHQVDGVDMLATKMDLLMKKLEAPSNVETAKTMDARMTCEVCGMWVIRVMIVSRQGKKPASSTIATTTGSATTTTTTTIKGGT